MLVPQLAQLPDGGEGAVFSLSAKENGPRLALGGFVSLRIAPFVGKAGERFAPLPPFFVGCLDQQVLSAGQPRLARRLVRAAVRGVGIAFASIPN